MEWTNGEFVLTDAIDRVDARRTYELLAPTYWGVRRPYPVVEKMIQNSLCFSLLHNDIQVGFGRAVTDYTVFAWIADIIIAPQHRGNGLGKWLMSCIVQHPLLQGMHMVLQTRDAHGLYEQYGFARNSALMATALQHGSQPAAPMDESS